MSDEGASGLRVAIDLSYDSLMSEKVMFDTQLLPAVCVSRLHALALPTPISVQKSNVSVLITLQAEMSNPNSHSQTKLLGMMYVLQGCGPLLTLLIKLMLQ